MLGHCRAQTHKLTVSIYPNEMVAHSLNNAVQDTVLETLHEGIWLLLEDSASQHASNTDHSVLSRSPIVLRLLALQMSAWW